MRNGRKEMIMLRSVTYAYRARDILAANTESAHMWNVFRRI